ncbi:hypothetical protein BDR03DRAFT_1003271 [Suillus americanus]|nr:hypothetical protein BDR03DRAFT_1003271 [Suillus americanus]
MFLLAVKKIYGITPESDAEAAAAMERTNSNTANSSTQQGQAVAGPQGSHGRPTQSAQGQSSNFEAGEPLIGCCGLYLAFEDGRADIVEDSRGTSDGPKDKDSESESGLVTPSYMSDDGPGSANGLNVSDIRAAKQGRVDGLQFKSGCRLVSRDDNERVFKFVIDIAYESHEKIGGEGGGFLSAVLYLVVVCCGQGRPGIRRGEYGARVADEAILIGYSKTPRKRLEDQMFSRTKRCWSPDNAKNILSEKLYFAFAICFQTSSSHSLDHPRGRPREQVPEICVR